MSKQMIILAVLVIALVGVFVWQFLLAGPGAGGAPPAQNTQAQTPAAPPADAAPSAPSGAQTELDVELDELLASVQQEAFQYEANRISRDPMRPLVGPASPQAVQTAEEEEENQVNERAAMRVASNMTLSGIMWDEATPMAVVNNQVVTQGFTFPTSGITVKDIQPSRVVLQVGEAEVPLDMEEQ
jgi:hypothetical protein